MKPYTLEWWLNIHYRTVIRSTYRDAIYYSELAIWIEKRINNKYGEKP